MTAKSLNRPKAYSYVRMSTEQQLRGDSLRRQLERSREYAKENGLELQEDFRLEDLGVSAFKGANVIDGALGRFLTAVRGGLIPRDSVLLIESLDRLSRQQVLKSFGVFTEIVSAGITIVTLADGRVYTADTDFSELILSLAIMSRAHDESQTKSYRGAAAWETKRGKLQQLKMTALCPAWLQLTNDRAQFDVIPERAAVVQSIFKDSADGIGSYSIARRLNSANVTPFGRSTGWQTSYVSKLLTSRAVLGEFQPHRLVDGKRLPEGPPTPNYFPRIVDDELFYKAQRARHQRRTGSSGRKGVNISNLFSQVAKCAYCRGTMVYINKGKPPKGGSYLVCDRSNRGLGCIKVLWRYDHFEASFLTFIEEMDLASLFSHSGGSQNDAVAAGALESLKGKISALEEQRERVYSLFIEGRGASDFVAKKIAEIDTNLAALALRAADMEKEVVKFSAAARLQAESKEQIKSLISELRAATGDEVYRLRAQLSARVRAMTNELLLAPAGVTSLDNYDFGPAIADRSLTPELVEEMKAEVAARPVLADFRYFSVEFRDGTRRKVSPSYHDPFSYDELAHQTGERTSISIRLGDEILSNSAANDREN